MRTILVYLVVIFMVLGCAGSQKMAKPSESLTAPKKFDLGEFHFKWLVMFPAEIFVGTLAGTIFMSPQDVQQMTLGAEKLEKKKGEEKGEKSRSFFHK